MTALFITLTNNYAHAIMKPKKTKFDYLRSLPDFVFIVNKLGSFEKPFHKLELRVSSGFPNTRKQFSFIVFGDLDETLVYKMLHPALLHNVEYFSHNNAVKCRRA